MKWILIAGSSFLHVGLLAGLGRLDLPEEEPTPISIMKIEDEPIPVPPEAEVLSEPPRPEPTLPEPILKKAPEVIASSPSPSPEPTAEGPQGPVDIGLELGGMSSGPGGVAVATRTPVHSRETPAKVTRSLSPNSKNPASTTCSDPGTKPKLLQLSQPAYTSEARTNNIEGKVRVSIEVAQDGTVLGVKVLQSLGYGLDEAALNAARAAQFEAATRCGKPVAATFTISIRFSAS